ncbi:MAG: hypothetical protein IAE89_05735 [Anaerolineae bacterium]|nr:hypothetical protein [Anaerolineae bacterium]
MISRRSFLQVAGISTYGLSSAPLLNALTPFLTPTADEQEATFGRVLFPTPVTDDIGIVISSLIPDTVVQITSDSEATYTLHQGIVNRSVVQPMADFGAESFVPDAVCPVEVIAPAAAIRQWCAPTAPMLSRVGHGGVLHAIDSLVVQNVRWLGVASGPGAPLIGWTEAARWRETTAHSDGLQFADTIEIDRHARKLNVYGAGALLWGAGVTISRSLAKGQYRLDDRVISSESTAQSMIGIPWSQIFDGYTLSGAYWHNEFGLEAQSPVNGAAIQILPAASRWLFRNFRADGTLRVI